MGEPNIVHWEDYSNLPIGERLARFVAVISSIRNLLKDYGDIEDIGLLFHERNLKIIKEGLKIFDFVVNMIDPSLTRDEIRTVETLCRNANAGHASLREVANLLRVIINIRQKLQKSYDDQLDLDYFGNLNELEDALTHALYNISPLDKNQM